MNQAQILATLEAIDAFVWGPVMLTILVGTGIYLTFRTKFLCWRNLPYSVASTLSKEARVSKGEGDVSPFACLCTALAATIGTGNIAGVANALATGGPGALIWMWISAAFGITSKFTECAIAVKYRGHNDKSEMLGGPMVAAEIGIPAVYGESYKGFGKFLAFCFALFAVFASFGIGNLTQGNSITEAFQNICGANMYVVGAIVGGLTLAIVMGGLKSISRVSSVIVPFMAVFYFVGAVIVIGAHVDKIPMAIVDMIRMAFSPEAVGGGIAGSVTASMVEAMTKGVARGCFSNEAGMGSAAISAAAATTESHIQQGYISSTGTFWDTFVVCSVTGLAVLTSGAMDKVVVDGKVVLKGAALTIEAFRTTLGPAGGWFVAIALAMFAFSTILGWEYNGEKCLEYLTKSTAATKAYRIIFSIVAFVGCISAFEIAWDISDILNALMILPNAVIMIMLVGPLVKDMDEYEDAKK